MLCPLLAIAFKDVEVDMTLPDPAAAAKAMAACRREECALWDGSCSFLLIGTSLARIADILEGPESVQQSGNSNSFVCS